MKVAVIGIGQLGSELVEVLGDRAMPIYHGTRYINQCDVMYRDSVYETLEAHKPDWVINTATSHNVDDLEGLPNVAFSVNAVGAYNVASVAKELNIGVVYISTNYVFGHNGPHRNSDYPRPLSVYGVSKLAGEQCTVAYAPRWLIVRTAHMFGVNTDYNFVQAMLRQKDESRIGVTDLVTSPAYAKDVARQIVRLIDEGYSGYTEHIVNDGWCSLPEFAREIFRLAGSKTRVEPVGAEVRDKAVRPRNGALVRTVPMRSWQEALKEYIDEA